MITTLLTAALCFAAFVLTLLTAALCFAAFVLTFMNGMGSDHYMTFFVCGVMCVCFFALIKNLRGK